MSGARRPRPTPKASTKAKRRSSKSWALDAATACTLGAALVYPVVVVACAVAVLAWVLASYRGAGQYRHTYTVASLRALRRRAGGRLKGRPGAFAQKLSRTHSSKAVSTALGAVAVAGTVAYYGLRFRDGSPVDFVLAGLAGVVLGVCVALVKAAPFCAAAGRAKAGARHELLTVGHILDADCVAGIVCGWLPPGRVGDLDAAAVLTSGVIVAIETKSGAGALHLDGDTLMAGSNQVPGDPVGQIRRAATATHTTLGVPVLPVVCIPRGTGRVQHPSGVHVVGGAELPALLQWAEDQGVKGPPPETTIKTLATPAPTHTLRGAS